MRSLWLVILCPLLAGCGLFSGSLTPEQAQAETSKIVVELAALRAAVKDANLPPALASKIDAAVTKADETAAAVKTASEKVDGIAGTVAKIAGAGSAVAGVVPGGQPIAGILAGIANVMLIVGAAAKGIKGGAA